MKEKMFSFLAWILVWVLLSFSYNYFFIKTATQFWWKNWVMTEERLQSTADRLWMTKEELQKELDAGKTTRQLMQEKWVNFWSWRWWSGTTRQNNQ